MESRMSWAVVKEGPESGFALRQVPVRAPGPGEVRIKVEAAGICGSDVPLFTGRRKLAIYPTIPGHEFSGTVEEVGAGVQHLRAGDRCSVSLVVTCGRCRSCLTGKEPRCPDVRFIGFNGFHGGFSQFAVVPSSVTHVMPDAMSFEEGASIDPVASAYRPVKKACITTEDTVIIIGPGPIGLYALQLARLEGARRTIVLGTRPSRLEVARRLGADVLVNVLEDEPVKKVAALLDRCEKTVVIEATGSASAVPLALSLATPGSRVAFVGIFHEPATIDPAVVVNNEVSVFGTHCYTRDEFLHCMDLVASGRVSCKEIITHVVPLREMDRALDLIHRREAIKVLLRPQA